jgi:hypothetical protein
MKIDSIRGWIEVTANVGLMIGIIFLVIELNQNAISQRTQARISLSERYSEQDGSVAENPQLAALLSKADVQGEQLNEVERRQYQGHYDRWMNILMTAQEMLEDGVIHQSDWNGYLCEVRLHYLRSQNFQHFVEGAKQRYLTDKIYLGLTTTETCGT